MRAGFQNSHILAQTVALAAWLILAPLAQSRAAGTPAAAGPPAGAALSTATLTQVSSEMRDAIQSAIAKVYPALVRINVVLAYPSEGRLSKEEGAGSGVIISKEGHVITNHHVAGKARRTVCRRSARGRQTAHRQFH